MVSGLTKLKILIKPYYANKNNITEMEIKELESVAAQVRRDIVRMVHG